MTSTLVSDYLAGLHRRLPTAIAEEAAAGLIETYEHHLATGAGDQEAARAALADFGALGIAVTVSLSRIAFTAWMLPRLTLR